MRPSGPIVHGKFRGVLDLCPAFTKDDLTKLNNFLVSRLRSGQGLEVLKKIEQSKYRPSKKLMDYVGNVG